MRVWSPSWLAFLEVSGDSPLCKWTAPLSVDLSFFSLGSHLSGIDLVENKEEIKEKMAGHEENKTVRTQREEDIVVCHLSLYACHRMLGAYYFFPFFINLLLIQSGQFATKLYYPERWIPWFYFEGSVKYKPGNYGNPPKDGPRRWLRTWVPGQKGFHKISTQ